MLYFISHHNINRKFYKKSIIHQLHKKKNILQNKENKLNKMNNNKLI